MQIEEVIDNVRIHICQDFLKMIVVDDWQEKVYSFTQKSVNGKYKNNYIEQYKKMRKKGFENYSIDDMDVSFIANILFYGSNTVIKHQLSNRTLKALESIKEDRNTAYHSSGNETTEELYLRNLIFLRDLQNFLHIVDLEETFISDENRSLFVIKYSTEIDEIKLEILNGYIEALQIKKDIQKIKLSDDQTATFYQIYKTYINRSGLEDSDKYVWHRFVVEASNADIKASHSLAASYFLYIKHDFHEATHRYEMMVKENTTLEKSEAHSLTSFINTVYKAGKEPTKRMMELLKLVKDQGFKIEEAPHRIIWPEEEQ